MVRHCGEVERAILGVDAGREAVGSHPHDRPSFGEAVGVAGLGAYEAKAGIERQAGVQMRLAKEGLP
jgi:hypothetical protein